MRGYKLHQNESFTLIYETMKTKKIRNLALFLILPALSLIQPACSKSSDNKNKSIEGLWIGYFMVDGQPGLGQNYFSFVIKPDGSLINDSKANGQQHLNIGDWLLVGDSLFASTTCVYGLSVNIGVEEEHKALVDLNAGKITGTWENVDPLSGSGTFSMTRVE